MCLCEKPYVPIVYYFKNNALSKAENSGFKMCFNTRECITYGKGSARVAAVKLVKGCNAVAIRIVYSKQWMVYRWHDIHND
jgi:hypothetical protein